MNRSKLVRHALGGCIMSAFSWMAILLLASESPAQETQHERSARIEGLSVAEKNELHNKLERFFQLPEDTRQRMTALDAALAQHPSEAELRDVMRRYYDWLKTLNPIDRAKLLDLPPNQRVTEIKRLIAAQEKEQFESLSRDVFRDIIHSPEEFSTIRAWLEQWPNSHHDEILAAEEQIYDKVPWLKERLEDADQQRKVFVLWAWMYRVRGIEPLHPSDSDFQDMTSRLKEDTQKRLKALPPERQTALLRDLMRAAVISHFHSRIDDDDLQKFYRQLPEQKQAELAALPPDGFDRALRREYMKENGSRMMGGRPPGPPPWDRDGRNGRRDRGGRDRDGRDHDERRKGDESNYPSLRKPANTAPQR